MSDMHIKIVRHLRELVAALDRRRPRVERTGEATIARESAALRTAALRRIVELEPDVVPEADAPR